MPFAQAVGNFSVDAVRLELFVQPPNILGAIAMFFVLPAVARTVRPEFAMTVGRVFGIIGILIVLGVVVEVGLILLIVPGVYILVNWVYWLAQHCELLVSVLTRRGARQSMLPFRGRADRTNNAQRPS